MSDFPREDSRHLPASYRRHTRYPTHVSGMTVQAVEIQAWYFVFRPSVNIARPRKICEITSQPCHGWMGYGITSNSGRDIFQDEEDSTACDIWQSRWLTFFFSWQRKNIVYTLLIISFDFVQWIIGTFFLGRNNNNVFSRNLVLENILV